MGHSRVLSVCGASALALLASRAAADTLDVPGSFPTIQAAIDAAQPGDVVLVAPGTYVERIDFLGKAITVEGSGGADVTTINAGGTGSVVTFMSDETNASVLRGFTVTGGTGTPLAPSGVPAGGGLFIDGASPFVSECVVTGNGEVRHGGGIYARGGSPELEDCVVTRNATTSPGGAGGGVMIELGGHLALRGCSLSANHASQHGGGFMARIGSVLTMEDCVVAGNTAGGSGGGGSFSNDGLGSFTMFAMSDCLVAGNSASSGGGLTISIQQERFSNPSAVVQRCRLERNSADRGGGVIGFGNSFSGGGTITVRNSVLVGNTATESGGAAAGTATLLLRGCTVVDNVAPVGGGLHGDQLKLGPFHCIFWGNSEEQIAGTLPDPRFCDVQGGFPGTGNIDVDPHFVDAPRGDYHLAPTSACLEAGDPAFFPIPADETDLDGDPRELFDRVDIGADEATFEKGAWTFLGHALGGGGSAPSLTGTGTLEADTVVTLVLASAAPSAPAWLVLGDDATLLPFQGGVLVPHADVLVGPLATDTGGTLTLHGRWPVGVPSGLSVYLQVWVLDAAGPLGFTASNGLSATAP